MKTPALRVCSFESRRREEMSRLVERSHGIATNVPALREIPLTDNVAAFQFAERLLAGEIDVIVFMTGVGAEALFATLATRAQDLPVREAMSSRLIVVRGPKPAAALARLKIHVDIKVPEPNTWEQVTQAFVHHQIDLNGKMVAVQEYGQPSHEFYDWLQSRGARVLPVPVYQWALPEDLEPLQQAIRETIAGHFDILLWTSAQQVNHVLETAEAMGLTQSWREAANRCVIGSIGPTATARLRLLGLPPDVEPSHPRMGHLVIETLAQAPTLLAGKHKK